MVHSVIAQSSSFERGFPKRRMRQSRSLCEMFFLTTCEGAYKLLNCLILISLL